MIEQLMKECAALGLKIDPIPDYPLQLFYSEGEFCAAYEPNMASLIQGVAPTAEQALQILITKMTEFIGNDFSEANDSNTFDVAFAKDKIWVHSRGLSYVWKDENWTHSVPSAYELDEDYRQLNNPALARNIARHALVAMCQDVPLVIYLRKPSLGLPFTESSTFMLRYFLYQ